MTRPPISAALLATKEIEIVKEIGRMVKQCGLNREASLAYRRFLKGYNTTHGTSIKFNDSQFSKLINGRFKDPDYIFTHLFYFFLVHDFMKSFQLKAYLSEEETKILGKIKELREYRESNDPDRLIPSEDTNNNLESFLGNFFGYRLSSNKGEIVRFGISIAKSEKGVSFFNKYNRDGVAWVTQGLGTLNGRTLYLWGQALDKEKRFDRGYRFFALQRWHTTTVITGVVISKDEIGPIASRIVLIPVDQHDFGSGRYLGAKKLVSEIQKHASSQRSQESRFAACETLFDYVFAQDLNSESYLGDDGLQTILFQQTDESLTYTDGSKNEKYEYNLVHFISNLTNTTLHGYDVSENHYEARERKTIFDFEFKNLCLIFSNRFNTNFQMSVTISEQIKHMFSHMLKTDPKPPH